MKHYTEAELECGDMRRAYHNAVALMKRVNPRYKFDARSSAVLADKHMTRFCNELRRYAAEADQQSES